MIFDPHPPLTFAELVERGFLTPIKNYHPMKKLIPFDIDKARAGAKVVTETGQGVTVITYALQVEGLTKKYILGRFVNPDMGGTECYEVWPQSGKFEDGVGRGPNLMIEEEIEVKGYSVSGDTIAKDGKGFIFVSMISGDNTVNKDELLHRIADALNHYENISEVEYEDEPAVRASMDLGLATHDKILGEEIRQADIAQQVATDKEIARLQEEARAWAARFREADKEIQKLKEQLRGATLDAEDYKRHYLNTKSNLETAQKRNDQLTDENRDLKAWKESEISVWGAVQQFIYDNPHKTTVGDSIAKEVLRRLQSYDAIVKTLPNPGGRNY
jgi:hypothetical protein